MALYCVPQFDVTATGRLTGTSTILSSEGWGPNVGRRIYAPEFLVKYTNRVVDILNTSFWRSGLIPESGRAI